MAEPYDYVSPGWPTLDPWPAFPNALPGGERWIEFDGQKRMDLHRWYYDPRCGPTGFINTDEAAILYQYALAFQGKRALEIGCHVGFSAWHLLKGGVELSICDPALHDPTMRGYVAEALAPEFDCAILGLGSPDAVYELAGATPWSLVFIDGDHHAPRPAVDALAASHFCAPDAAILFHDGWCSGVQDAITLLRAMGWKARLYRTSQLMAMCWRGGVEPIEHVHDPAVTMPAAFAARDWS